MLLLHLAIIIILAKVFAFLSTRIRVPPIIGMIVTGLILGPTLIGFMESDEVIHALAVIGVNILLFIAGLETDISLLRKQKVTSMFVAVGGVTLPFIGGFILSMVSHLSLIQGLIVGTILTATSVSITVAVLHGVDKLRSVEGTVILGAAVLDDIIGVLLLTFIFAVAGVQTSIVVTIIKLFAYLIVASLVGYFLFPPLMYRVERLRLPHVEVAIGLSLAFIYAWSAQLVGIASITGAYLAGLFLARTRLQRKIATGMEIFSEVMFGPIFFVNVGLEANLRHLVVNPTFVLLFVLLAILLKMFGAMGGAKLAKLDTRTSLKIGVGMTPRGEVALIVGTLALSYGYIGLPIFNATVVMVLVTSVLAPLLLYRLYGGTASASY